MTLRQRSRLRRLMAVFGVLLLAQWTLVAQACPIIKAAGEFIEVQAQLADAPPCHQSQGDDGVRAVHCAGDDQMGASAVTPALPPAAPALTLRLPPAPAAHHCNPHAIGVQAVATAPPLIILYCVFLA